MRSFSKKLAFVLAAAMVFTAFAPAAKAEAAAMKINKSSKILYVTDGEGINDAAQVGGGKGNVAEYDFSVSNKPKDYKKTHTFEWSSSDEDVIEVGKAGLTKAVGVGVANVVCVVTEKATGKATTLKSEVTVKANAAEVVITNADDYADLAYEVGAEIDLNRAMYDAEGKKAPKRGVKVTDYTRWMVEPSAGVKVTQSNGKYVFTDEAEAGTYKLWCETYQSSKYTKTTAKSQVIEVELVKEKTFEVAQSTTTKFTVNFSQPVSALATADVTVARLFGTYEYNNKVKTVKLADDKMSATVEVFDKLADQKDYKVTVKGFEDTVFNASAGKPVDLVIIAVDGNGAPLNPDFILTTKNLTNLQCVFYDAKGVEVERSTNNVVFSLEKNSTNGDYFLSGPALRINKTDVSVVVKASYQGWVENGKRVGNFERTREFCAVDQAPVTATAVADYTLNDEKWGGDAVKSMQVKDTPTLTVKITKSNGQGGDDKYTNNSLIRAVAQNAYVTFEAVNPKVAVLNGNQLKAFQAGIADFYVNIKINNNVTPIGVVTIEVKDNADLSYVTADKQNVVIGTATGFDTDSIKIFGHNQYDAKMAAPFAALTDANFKVECFTEGFGNKTALANVIKNAATIVADDGDNDYIKLNINANSLKNEVVGNAGITAEPNGQVFALDFRATYTHNNSKKTIDFTVVIQEPNNSGNYYSVVANKDSIDASRLNNSSPWDAKNQKSITFSVFEMNNGVKVASVTNLAKYESEEPTTSKLYYKILKDGSDLNVATTPGADGDELNEVSFKLSGETPLTDAAIKAQIGEGKSVVNYNNVGAGTYTFILFKYTEDGNYVADCSTSVSVSVTDAGAYSIAGDQKANKVTNVDKESILKCFTINDRNGNSIFKSNGDVKTTGDGAKFCDYYVNYVENSSDYVYVKEITFYEAVANNLYVPYKVTIDTVLNK